MYHVKTDNQVVVMWESVAEPAANIPNLSNPVNRTEAKESAEGKRHSGDGERWWGAPNFPVMQERLKRGWPEGVERLQKLATRDLNPTSLRRRRYRADQGDEIDMQAVYRGDLARAWTRTRRQSRAGTNRTVTLVCNLSDSAGTSGSELFWRGAAALKLADALTQAGYNVGIYGAITSNNCGARKRFEAAQFVEIKAPDMPLDVSQLAALTAMPGWFRSAGFAGIVTCADLMGDTVDSSYGTPAHNRIPAYAEAIGLTNCYVQGQVNSKDSAEAWIDSVMQQIEPAEATA